uniref:Transposase n=1 Tax=Trichogramma kaykai TaxID=54128 RepID=A0ABD2X6B2_9HYME
MPAPINICRKSEDNGVSKRYMYLIRSAAPFGNKKDYLENEINNSQLDQLVEIPHSKKLTKQEEFGLTAVIQRWRNLCDSYQKARNKILAHAASEATYNIEPSFRFYNQMLFLSDYPHTHQ